MSQIDFYHCDPCKPTVVANKLLASRLVCDEHFKEKETDDDSLSKSAKVIRKELGNLKSWEFTGSLDNFDAPTKCSKLVNSIISGGKIVNERKQKEIEVISSNIVQYICSNFKSDRQILYNSNKDHGFEKHRLTPFSVGIALQNYLMNRSKMEIGLLSNVGLSMNYDHLQRTVTGIANGLIETASANDLGIILPTCIKKGIRPVFAADNIDLGSDAESFHGADLMIVQEKDPNGESLFPVRYSYTHFEFCSKYLCFQEIFFDTKHQKRSLSISISPEIDENVELTIENDSTFKTPIVVNDSYLAYSRNFQQLNLIWMLLSNSKFVSLSSEVILTNDSNLIVYKISSAFPVS